MRPLIANVHVYPDFAVIERGDADGAASVNFASTRYLLAGPKAEGRTSAGFYQRRRRKLAGMKRLVPHVSIPMLARGTFV